MPSKIAIVKAAVARLGEEVPQSLNEDVDALIAQDAIYDTMVGEALASKQGWWFATKWRTLTANGNTPPDPWISEYPKPSEIISIQDVVDCRGMGVLYEMAENVIYTQRSAADALTLIYTYWPSEALWPYDFAGAMEEELLGRLLGAFEERIRSVEIREIADKKLQRAFRRQMRQKPPQQVNEAPLLRAWYGRITRRY